MNDALDAAVGRLLRATATMAIMPRYRRLRADQIVEKGTDDLVTIADREAELMLADGLAQIEPSAAIVGEEAAAADPAVCDRLSQLCWIIDPIDGTNNFARGEGHFGIMVALADGGLAQHGWIYNPMRQRLLTAHRGSGAFSDGARITAMGSGQEPPVISLMQRFMSDAQRQAVASALLPLMRADAGPGCAAEEYPRVAMGECDAALYQRTLAWDHAAGCLWLNEAGGRSARLDGSDYRVDDARGGMLAASGSALFETLAERLLAAGYQ